MSCDTYSVSFDQINEYESYSLRSDNQQSSSNLHEAIFPGEWCLRSLKHDVSLTSSPQKITNAAKIIAPLKAGGSVELGGKIEWGGQNGIEISAYGKAEGHDDKGNTAEISVEQNSDGSGNATVSVSHEE